MMAPSDLTLATLRARVEQALQDTGNTRWTADDVDEAIRQALQRYSQLIPAEAIAAIALAAAGREIDISSLTGYIKVLRVWWDYDATDPDYPPHWRDFELWPGDLLFVKSASEPSAGDTVRVWYTKPQTLSGLDGAAATTFQARDESLLVIGAAAFAAYSRAVGRAESVNVDGYTSRKLRDWSELRMAEFEAGLHQLSRLAAADAAGIAPGPPLDRWDEYDDGWY
jgi:hypothetical protein